MVTIVLVYPYSRILLPGLAVATRSLPSSMGVDLRKHTLWALTWEGIGAPRPCSQGGVHILHPVGGAGARVPHGARAAGADHRAVGGHRGVWDCEPVFDFGGKGK